MTKTVRAAAYAPDGQEIVYHSTSKWDVAGLIQNHAGGWFEAAHGGSYDSVRKRAVTYAYRFGYDAPTVTAVPIYEATAPVVREYFGHHKVNVAKVFIPGAGWVDGKDLNGGRGMHGGWSNIRKLSLRGITDIAFESFDADLDTRLHIGPAEFTVAVLLKSMHLPRQRMCATVGHGNLPATHKISYRYRDEDERETELVCASCADSYSRRTVLTHFSSHPLAA